MALRKRSAYLADVIERYDDVADRYDGFYTTNADLAEDDVIFGLARRLAKGRHVVDIGCGPGTAYGHGVVGKSYLGVDPSEGMIREARARYPLADFMVGELFMLESESAGLLLGTFGPLCHIAEPLEFAHQAARVVEPGGRIMLMAPRWPSVARINGAPMFAYEPYTLRKTFERYGFLNTTVTGFDWLHGPHHGPRWLLRAARRSEMVIMRLNWCKWLILEGVRSAGS